MRSIISLAVLVAVLTLPPQARAQLTDAADITATLELIAATPACDFTPGTQIDFAQAERPADAALSGDMTLDPTAATDILTYTHVVPHGTPTLGAAAMSGSNIASYTVTVPPAFASATMGTAPSVLSFAGTWAEGSDDTGPFTAIAGASYAGTGGGDGTSTSRHFRFGGTVSEITRAKDVAVYSVTFQVSLSCQ